MSKDIDIRIECCNIWNALKDKSQMINYLVECKKRIAELEDKDWYEANIKQLEEQNDRLIQERDNLKQQLIKLQSENKMLKEFADKLDEEFGKNVEPTLGEKADNIIALYRTNKKYCEMADEKIKELKLQLVEKENKIKRLEDYKFRNIDYKVYYESTAMNYHDICEVYKNKIQELKHQLEEEKAKVLDLKLRLKGSTRELDKTVNDMLHNENQRLIQKLVEKDKEIEDWKNKTQTFFNIVNEQNYEMANNNPTQLAITELEKVKDTLKHFCNIHSDEYYGVKAEVKGIELDVCESIDYQIKELKGENK